MRVSRFKIENYKIIDDTGDEGVTVDENVTAFVGKNESGKTAILRALWKSRNVADEEFDKLLDYPKGRYAKERTGNQYVTHITFGLEEDEAEELAALFPFEVDPLPKEVTLQTRYLGEEEVSRRFAFESEIEERCKRGIGEGEKAMQAVATALAKHVGEGDTSVADALETAKETLNVKQPVWQDGNRKAVEAFQAAAEAWISKAAERTRHGHAHRKALAEIVAEAQKGDPAAGGRKWAEENMPIFIYFSDYGQLETRIHLPTYIAQAAEKHVSPRVRTQRALFRQANLDPAEVLQLGRPIEGEDEADVYRRLEKRRTLTESASFSLTGDWLDWWIPETRHQLHISADGDYLVLNVSDTQNPFQIPFEERSQGFQWFFSFYLVFLVESEGLHEDAVLLLDEPGLHLHPTMQQKLVQFFDRVAKTNQLLYSTHLPFLVDGDRLERVRTVYLSKEKPPKTVVSSDPCAGGDRDTLFPLQAALGYSIAQTLFMGKSSLIVEGTTDFMLMKALNAGFMSLGSGTRLHEEIVLVPAGGTNRLMPLASIMFASTGVEGRRMLVLLDSDAAGESTGDRLKRELFAGEDSGVLMLGSALGLPVATIEDLVPRKDYAQAVGTSLGRSVKLDAAETSASTNVGALAKHWERQGWGKFGKDEKLAAALWLGDSWLKDSSTIPTDTRARAAALFAAVNKRFGK